MKNGNTFVVTVAALLVVGLFLLHRWNEMADEQVFQVNQSPMRYLGRRGYQKWLREQLMETNYAAPQSNAALMALLPQFSDCAKKLDLPVPTPNEVARFMPPVGDMLQAALGLTNGYLFRYYNGAVSGFESPDDLYALQEFVDMERFIGKGNMTTNDAIALARAATVTLGYKLTDFHMDEPPTRIEGPSDWKDIGHMAFCRVTWRGGQTPFKDYSVQFDVNMQHKRLVGMDLLLGKAFWRSITNLAQLTNSPPISLSPVN